MFAVSPMRYIGMKEMMMVMGIVMIGTMARGMCQRKIMMTMLTMMSSSISVPLRVSMARSIKSDRDHRS